MLGVILTNTIQLLVDNPLSDPESTMSKFLVYLDIILTTIFGLEAVLKIIAFGFLRCGSTSYIKNSWNTLDFIIASISVRFIS